MAAQYGWLPIYTILQHYYLQYHLEYQNNYITYICNYINMHMLDIYVYQILIVLIRVKHIGQLPSQTKNQMKKCFICVGKVIKCSTFAQHQTRQLGKCLCAIADAWVCLAFYNPSISGFDNIFLLIYVLIVHHCVRTFFLCLFSFDGYIGCIIVLILHVFCHTSDMF